MADEKLTNSIKDEDTPEGKMELSFRILGHEMVGIKMIVDDMKMKWVFVGLVALLIMLWAAAHFAPAIINAVEGSDDVYIQKETPSTG